MRILLTGATGFAGSWLAEALLEQGGHELAGLSLSARWPPSCRHLEGRVTLFPCDLSDSAAAEAVLRRTEPEQIYHLAGYPHAGKSFSEPDAAWQGNLTATRSLYDAVRRWGGRPRILAVSSAMVYGDPRSPGEVLNEESPLRPVSPYGVSKAAADLLGYQLAVSGGLDIVRVRPFNHIGPRQPKEFAVSNFARQLAEIQLGKRPPVLETGGLSAERDLTDVRDIARAYMLLMERGRAAEAYNLGSGVSRTMRFVLDELIRLAGIEVEVRTSDGLLRPTEPMHMRVSNEKLRAETGWAPRFTLEQSLRDILADWRANA